MTLEEQPPMQSLPTGRARPAPVPRPRRGATGERARCKGLSLSIAVFASLALGLFSLFSSSLAQAQISDDFNACEIDGGVWTFVDPLGDATATLVGGGTGDAVLQIDVPGGQNHEPWTTNTAARLLQPMADVDFAVEAKFDSIPDARYEMQGVLVQQTDDTFLRFEYHWAGTGHYAYVASIDGGSASTKTWTRLADIPRYMRVTRSGDQWTLEWAAADQVFETVASFSQAISVSEIGPYGGNYASGSAPQFTALIDYFFATAAPIVPEDGAALPLDRSLTVDPSGGGSVQVSPDQPAYACNQTVTLTAVPDAGYVFDGWGDDLAGTESPETLSMAVDRTVSASFSPDAVAPVISNVTLTPSHDSIRVRWDTDQPASSRVEWGDSPAYTLGLMDDPAPVTSHDMTIPSLAPESLYYVQVSSTGSGGGSDVVSDLQSVTTMDPATVPSGFYSDDFNDCALDASRWTVVDPLGGATVTDSGGGSADARLSLSIPGSQTHNPWTTNESVRVLQSVNDTDLSVEASFDSVLSQGYQMQGLTIQESASHYLRLELYHDGTSLHAFAAILENGASSIVDDVIIASADRIRVTRVGDDWTLEHSTDGQTWTQAAAFAHAMVVTAVGPHAGNFDFGGVTPDNTVLVDYVFTTSSPIADEDGAALPVDRTLGLTVVGNGMISVSPDQPLYACNDVVTLTAAPDVDHVFSGWSGDLSGLASPIALDMSQSRSVTATFDVYLVPPLISNIQVTTDPVARTATITWDTDLPADSQVDYGKTPGYELGAISSSPLTQSHSIALSNLTPGTQHYYQVSSVTAEGGAASGPGGTFTVPLLPGQDPSGIYSDDFNTCAVDTLIWEINDPLDDGSVSIQGSGSGDSKLLLSVPAGADHEPWRNDTSLSLLQPANDTDLDLVAKFDSTVSLRYQQQGILVKQADDIFLRFEFYSDGVETYGLIAFVNQGSASVLENVVVTTAAYMNVVRTGDDFSFYASPDGSAWTLVGSVNQAMSVTRVGPYGGNFASSGDAPAHTAIIDYFHNRALALDDEDLGTPPGSVTLTTSVNGPGTASVSPSAPSYACGTNISLWATAQPGFEFTGWSGDYSSAVSPINFNLVRDTFLLANFAPDTTPPGIEAIGVSAGASGAEVKIVTDELTTATLSYGPDIAYTLGSIDGAGLATVHELILPDLAPTSAYHFEVVVTDIAGLSSSSGDQTFTTSVAPGNGPAGLYSDDFNACAVDTGLWTLIDPKLDATFEITGAGSGDAKIEISVPAGSSHEPWAPSNQAPRLMQAVADTDFEIEVRFDSPVTERYQEQGLIVEADAQTFLRFDVHSDGSANYAFAGYVEPSGATVAGLTNVAAVNTLYMRVTREGDLWTHSYSYDGITWAVANQFSFAMVATQVGFFAGNASGSSSPAHTAVVDYFWTTASPTVPEDVGGVGGAKTLNVLLDGPGSVDVDPDQAEYGCGETVVLNAVPDPGYAFDGWSGALAGDDNPETLSMPVDRRETASFVLAPPPPIISNEQLARGPSSAIVTWTTNEPTTSRIDYGLTTSYELGYVESGVFQKNHTMVVPGLDSAQSYQLEITATDGAAFQTTSGNLVVGPSEGPTLDIFQGLDQTFGQAGAPQPMFNVLGNASDPDGVSSLTWSLNGGPAYPLSMGWDRYRLDLPGDFNAEIPRSSLLSGLNTVLIRAVDGLGNESVELVAISYTPDVIPTLPYAVDFTSISDIQDHAQPIDGDWTLDPAGLRAVEMGYDRIVGVGDLSWTDYELTARVTVNEIEYYYERPSSAPAIGVIVRWPGHTPDGEQPARQWWPLGAYATYRWFEGTGGVPSESKVLYGDAGLTHGADSQGIPLQLGTPYVFKLRIETQPDGGSLYSYKMWKEIDGEPAGWDLQGLEPPGVDGASGSVLLVNHHVDATWHDVVVTPVP